MVLAEPLSWVSFWARAFSKSSLLLEACESLELTFSI